MAPRKLKKKGSHLSPSENPSSAEQWPDLPQQLLNFIGRKPHLNLIQNVGSAGVMKSWKMGTNRCVPNLKSPILELHQESCNTQLFNLSIKFHQGCFWWWPYRRQGPPEKSWGKTLGCSHGMILTPYSFCDPTKTYLHNWFLPPWDAKTPIQKAVFSSFLTDPNGCCSVMAITGSSLYGVSRVECSMERQRWLSFRAKEWSMQDTTLIDPNDSEDQPMKFTNLVGCNGRYYALTLQGTLAVIQESEETDSQFQITKLCRRRAVPSGPSRRFVEYLIESNGEILLVFLVCRKSAVPVDHVEVLRLQVLGGELSWIKVESLGDRTLFVGTNSSMSVTASLVGCRNNSVYFTHRGIDSWRLYDMETGSILPCFEMKSPVWEEPKDGQ